MTQTKQPTATDAAPLAQSLTAVEIAMQAAGQVKEALAQLGAQKVALTRECAELHARNAVLWTLPVRRDEAKAYILDFVDAKGAEFERTAGWDSAFEMFALPTGPRKLHTCNPQQDSVEGRHGGPLCMADIDRTDSRREQRASAVSYMVAKGPFGFLGEQVPGGGLKEASFYFFFSDAIKAKVEKYFDRRFPPLKELSGNTRAGMTLAEKRTEMAANDARITLIDADLVVLDQQVEALKAGSK